MSVTSIVRKNDKLLVVWYVGDPRGLLYACADWWREDDELIVRYANYTQTQLPIYQIRAYGEEQA